LANKNNYYVNIYDAVIIYIYKSLFTTWVANRQTKIDRKQYSDKTREEEKNTIQFTTSTIILINSTIIR